MADKTQETKKKLIALQAPSSWSERRDIPLTILAWLAIIVVASIVFGYISRTIFILVIAALLAYTLTPAVKFVGRFVPRFLAIGIVYVFVISVFNIVIYYILTTALDQVALLIHTIQKFLIPKTHTTVSPLLDFVKPLGITQEQLTQIAKQLTTQLEHLFSSIFPFIQSVFSYVLDIIIILVVSIYLILDGRKIINLVQTNVPISQKRGVLFFMNTSQRIAGAYIRGQLLLSVIIGFLVGLGMLILNVPYAVLLGVLAFILSFIPVLGTFISGAACVLIALTKGWILALIVLGYFIVIHVIEGDIIGPRIVGRALGLHPLVSLLAVITGSELFGIKGALFSAPIAGIAQALLAATWTEWKTDHHEQFSEKQTIKRHSQKTPAKNT